MMNWMKIKAAAMILAATAVAATAGVGTVAILKAQETPAAQPGNSQPDGQAPMNLQGAAAPDPAPAAFVANLSNGVSVEVIGIGGNPSNGQPMWKADGSPLEHSPDRSADAHFGEPGLMAREIAVRINTSVAGFKNTADVKWTALNSLNWVSNTPDQPMYPGLETCIVGIPDSLSEMTIRADVAVGEWTAQFTANGRGSSGQSTIGLFGLGKKSVLFGMPVENRGKTQIAISGSGLDANLDVRAVAIDMGKRVHPCDALNILNIDGTVMGEFRTDLPAPLISEWELQTRPYDQWIEFRHVAVNPGQNTRVEIATSDDGGKH